MSETNASPSASASPGAPLPEPTLSGINHALVDQYAQGATEEGIRNLKNLFDYMRRSELRACELSRAYLKRIVELETRLSANDRQTRTLPEREPGDRDLAQGLKRARVAETKAREIAPVGDLADLEGL